MIQLKNVSKVYRNNHIALSNVNITINRGEFVFIVGPSGAGKSTLIKLLMKEIEPTSGDIIVGDTELSELKRNEVSYTINTVRHFREKFPDDELFLLIEF